MASTKYIITADVSQAQRNIDKLKVQYTSTLQDIAKNQELLKQKEQELVVAKQKRIGLASRSKELKEANAVVTKLNQEKVALEQVDKTLKRTLELNKAKVAVENDIIQGIQRELSATDRLKEAQRQQNIETAKAIRAEEELSRKRQSEALKANILAREQAKRQLQAQKDRLLINSRPEQIDRKYQNYLREVAELRKKGTISIYEERKSIRNLNQAKREELINNRSLASQIVRHIRQVESLAVAMYGLYRVWNSTMGVGLEFNKTVEDEGVGLKLLLVNSLANVDSQGKLLTLKDKYNIANSKYLGILQKIREINPETPYNLQDTIKVYKALFPQLIRHKATLSQIGEITKKLTIVAKANNLEVGQFLKTIDTAFTGEMKESQLSQALKRMGLTNKAIKEAIKNGTLLNLVFDKLKDVDSGLLGINDTWSNALSRFQTQWQELWGNLSMPTFIGFKQSINSITDYLKNNRAEVESFINTTASLAKQLVTLYAIYRISKAESLNLGKAIEWTSSKYKLWTTSLLGGRANMVAYRRGLRNLKLEFLTLGDTATVTSNKMGVASIAFNKVRIASSMLRLSIVALGRWLMSLVMANPVLAGLTVAFEAYNYVVGKSAEKQAELNRLLHITTEEYKKMGKAEALHSLDVVREKLITQRQITSELRRERASIKANYGLHSAEYHAINDKYEAQIRVVRELDNTRISLADVINGTYQAVDAVYKTANGANALANELNSAKFEAYGVASALDTSVLALQKTLIRARAMRGEINKIQSISLTATLDKKAVDSQLKEALGAYDKLGNKDSDAREKALQKLNVKVAKLVNKQKLIELDTEQKLKRAKEESARAELRANKAKLQHSIILAKNNKHYKQAIALEKKSIALEKSAIINKLKSNNGVEKINLQTQLQELENRQLSKTYSLYKKIDGVKKHNAGVASKAHKDAIKQAKQHQKELQKLAKEAEKVRLQYADIFKGSLGSIFNGDFSGGISSLFGGLGDKLMQPLITNLSNSLSTSLSSLTSGLSPLIGGIAGLSLNMIPSLLSGLFSNKLSEADIRVGKGKTEFTDSSITKLTESLKSAETPLLPYTKKMTDYLESMNTNFKSIAKGLSEAIATSGLNLTAEGYTPSQSNILGGLFSSQTQLVGSGLEFNNLNLNDILKNGVNVRSFLTEKETNSYLFGLVTTESLKTTYKDIPSKQRKQMQEAFTTGYKSIMESASLLGFNSVKDLRKVLNTKLDIGKIDFKGMNSEEIAKRLNSVFSEALSTTVESVESFAKLINRYSQNGEKTLETFIRIGVEYEQATNKFDMIGKRFLSTINGYTKQMKVLDIVKGAGGKDAFNSAMSTFIDKYYTETEKYGMNLRMLSKQFRTLNIAIPHSKQGFRDLIEGFKVTDEATAKTYGQLLTLSGAFSELIDAEKKLQDERIRLLKEANRKWRDAFTEFWTGQNSPLDLVQKANFTDLMASNNLNAQSALDRLNAKRESSVYMEDYRQEGFSYLNKISKERDEQRKQAEKLADSIDKLYEEVKTHKGLYKENNKQNEELREELSVIKTEFERFATKYDRNNNKIQYKREA